MDGTHVNTSGAMFANQAVFLDRDGTLIRAVVRLGFSKMITAAFSMDELCFMPNAYVVLEQLKKLGFLRIMVTNQPDVELGYVSFENWRKIHQRVLDTFGAMLNDCYMCRHASKTCPHRKPSPAMLLMAAEKWGIDLSRSYMVGDTDADTQAGAAAGCRTILLRAPYNHGVAADFIIDDLAELPKIVGCHD